MPQSEAKVCEHVCSHHHHLSISSAAAVRLDPAVHCVLPPAMPRTWMAPSHRIRARQHLQQLRMTSPPLQSCFGQQNMCAQQIVLLSNKRSLDHLQNTAPHRRQATHQGGRVWTPRKQSACGQPGLSKALRQWKCSLGQALALQPCAFASGAHALQMQHRPPQHKAATRYRVPLLSGPVLFHERPAVRTAHRLTPLLQVSSPVTGRHHRAEHQCSAHHPQSSQCR